MAKYIKQEIWNIIYKRHVDYISEKISPHSARQFCGIIMLLYMKYVIRAILHGYKIVLPNKDSFSISRIPLKDIYKYRSFKFKSKYTSDWLFYFDIQSHFVQKNDLKYTPNDEMIREIKKVLNSETVYELIR